jgi:DNA-binding NarL/FixJ family response regulator
MNRRPPLEPAAGLRYLGRAILAVPPAMPTILVADDHPLFREALRGAVSRALPGARLHEADSVDALYALVEREPDADLLLLDLNMPGAHGFSALVHLRAHYPQLPVMVVSAREEPPVMRRALDHGAVGFLPKSADATTLGEAIDTVLAGDRWAPAAALKAPAAGADEHDAAARVRELTPQQFRVLQMLGDGLLNKQIAYELGVSEATIKAHMTAILRKLGASNRTQAVLIAGKLAVDPEAVTPPPPDDE